MPSPPPSAGGRTAPLRVAIVGIGSAATRAHLPALLDAAARGSIELAGACDRDPGHCRQALAGFSAPTFTDNAAMLDAVAPELLVIATPPSAHLEEIAAAMGRGVHVLCEKPLGLTAADAGTLAEVSAAHPELAIATVHQYRYAPAWTWLARAAAGAVRADEPFSIEVRVERPGTDPLSAGGWRAHPESEGGILGDHAVHYLSLLRLLDPDAAVTGCRRRGSGGHETASVELRVGAAGRARVDVSYAGERRRNVLVLERPAQCLRITWDGESLELVHGDVRGPARPVSSLSDRSFVNALYIPMYRAVFAGLRDQRWRQEATEHTLGVARLLAAAVTAAG